jgi:hypothetical protein
MNNQSLFVDLINQKRKYKTTLVKEKALKKLRPSKLKQLFSFIFSVFTGLCIFAAPLFLLFARF